MARSERLLQNVMNIDDNLIDNIFIQNIQNQIDGLVKEAAELHQAVYKSSELVHIPIQLTPQTPIGRPADRATGLSEDPNIVF